MHVSEISVFMGPKLCQVGFSEAVRLGRRWHWCLQVPPPRSWAAVYIHFRAVSAADQSASHFHEKHVNVCKSFFMRSMSMLLGM